MAETKLKSINLKEATAAQTILKVLQVDPTQILIEYDLLPDTNPGANGDYLAIWQNTNNIPYTNPADAAQQLKGSSQHGTVTFQGLEVTRNNYIIGYAVGPELTAPSQRYGNICSSAYIPMIQEANTQDSDPYQYFFSSLTLGVVTSNSVTFKYNLPSNCTPAANKAWVGLFRGDANYGVPPERAIQVTSNASASSMAFNDVKILFDTKYTIAFFMSGWAEATKVQTRMGATISFMG